MEDLKNAAELGNDILLGIIHTQAEIARAGMDLGGVMALAAERARQLTNSAGAVVELAEGDEMVYRAVAGIAENQLGLRLKLDGSLSGRCVQERRILQCKDSETDPRVDREACRRVGLRSMIVVPLNHLGLTVGVIKVVSSEVDAFSDKHIRTLELMSDLLAAAMFHSARFETSELYHRATHDSLTGLANRALYYDRLRQSLAQASRHAERVAVLNLDMDGLKPINDSLGHKAGDAALLEMAGRLARGCRQSDTVARVGGDEFGIILPRIPDQDVVKDYCERLATRISSTPLMYDSREVPLAASIGYAIFPDDGKDVATLLEKADQAMYEVKRRQKKHNLN